MKKILTVQFDEADLSAFPPESGPITVSNGAITLAGGMILFRSEGCEPTTIVPPHVHPNPPTEPNV